MMLMKMMMVVVMMMMTTTTMVKFVDALSPVNHTGLYQG